jgi:ferredoxin-NADP reductase
MHLLISNAPLILGLVLAALVVMQVAYWTASGLLSQKAAATEYQHSRQQFQERLAIVLPKKSQPEPNTWQGLRQFRVAKLIDEATDIVSVYLEPVDGKPLPTYQPGQFLTFHLKIASAHPRSEKAVVRCYSLSDAPNSNYYRCTIKLCQPPANSTELPAGKASSYLHRELHVGDTLSVRAASGDFYLDTSQEQSVVLLAGGIGITPLLSMIKTILQQQPRRKVALFYGVHDSRSHAFKQELAEIAAEHPNIRVINCYSCPLAEDKLGRDYQVNGRVSPELLAEVLPGPNFDFYLCGPPAFMETLFHGLQEWGASEERIHFEAFGPASVKKKNEFTRDTTASVSSAGKSLLFQASAATLAWDARHETILELAEANHLQLESGCRSGNCGTCVVRLLKGKVTHLKSVAASLEPDQCLACIAKPETDVVLDA